MDENFFNMEACVEVGLAGTLSKSCSMDSFTSTGSIKEEVKEAPDSPLLGGSSTSQISEPELEGQASVTSSDRYSPIVLPTTTDLLFPGETSEVLTADVIEEVST